MAMYKKANINKYSRFLIYLIIKHPVMASVVVILLLLFSIWFLKIMFRFVRKIFSFQNRKSLLEGG